MNIAIIGCGNVAKAHVRALININIIRKIFVYDIDKEKMAKFIDGYSKCITTESIELAIENSSGAIICTPNSKRINVIQSIYNYKPIPIMCEKPLASTLPEAIDIYNMTKNNISVIGFNYRFNPVISYILDLQKLKHLGKCVFISLAFNKKSAILRKEHTWRDQAVQNGSSGALGDLGSHMIDLVSVISQSYIINNTISYSKGTKVPFKSGAKVFVDDNCCITGITYNKTAFLIKANKAADDSELGLYINITFEKGEIYYNTINKNAVYLKHVDQLGIITNYFNYKQKFQDPLNEIIFWSDSFYLQDTAWIESLLATELVDHKLAKIEDGIKVQEIINKCL